MLLAVVAGTAAAISGCGGRDGSASDDDPPSKAEFVAQVNAACEQLHQIMVRERLEFERRRAGQKPEPGSVDMVHLVYLPAKEEQVSRIEAMRTPRGEVGRVEELLDAARIAIDNAATDLRIPSIAAAQPYFAESDKLYWAYGLDACAD